MKGPVVPALSIWPALHRTLDVILGLVPRIYDMKNITGSQMPGLSMTQDRSTALQHPRGRPIPAPFFIPR